MKHRYIFYSNILVVLFFVLILSYGFDIKKRADRFTIANETKIEYSNNRILFTNLQPILESDRTIDVNLFTAILGGKADFKTFKGAIKVNIAKESSNNKIIRLQKMGMPKYGKSSEYGDLYLKLYIVIPQNLTQKELNLFKELQKLREQ